MFEPGKLQYLLEEPLKAARAKTPLVVGTREHFLDWLSGKPANGTYCYRDCGNCLFYHYGKDHGGVGTGVQIYNYGVDLIAGKGVLGTSIAFQEPHTFGAAVGRARALGMLS